MRVRLIQVVRQSALPGEATEVEKPMREFRSCNTPDDARATRRLVGWKETRTPERDADGYTFYRFDFYDSKGRFVEAQIVGYKEDTPDAETIPA